jgi:hypothetical protein
MALSDMFKKIPVKPELKVLDTLAQDPPPVQAPPEVAAAPPDERLPGQVTDEEFDAWLAKKYTTKNDFKMKSSWFKNTVLYVLISLDLEPTMGNYRKYDPILDWKAICLNDLRRKGIK